MLDSVNCFDVFKHKTKSWIQLEKFWSFPAALRSAASNHISRLSVSGYRQDALLPDEWKKHSGVKAISLKTGSSLASQTISLPLAQLLFNTSPACHSALSTQGVCWRPRRPERRFRSTSAWPRAKHSTSISSYSPSLGWETGKRIERWFASFQVDTRNCRHLDC